jgi:hypothetical protein
VKGQGVARQGPKGPPVLYLAKVSRTHKRVAVSLGGEAFKRPRRRWVGEGARPRGRGWRAGQAGGTGLQCNAMAAQLGFKLKENGGGRSWSTV